MGASRAEPALSGRPLANGPTGGAQRLPFDTFPAWAERWISAGTAPYSRLVRRRLRIMNMVAYLVAFFTLIYALQYAVLGLRQYWLLVVTNLAIVGIALSVPLFHRINAVVGGVVLIIAEFIALFIFTVLLGKASGVHVQYFACAAAPFFVLGVERWRSAFLLVGIALILHLLAWHYLPPIEGVLSVDPAVLRGSYVIATLTTFGMVAVIIFYAFRWAEQAREQADTLLANALPLPIVERLKDHPNSRIADRHDTATVLFADLVGFTPLSRGLAAEDLVKLLNDLVTELDVTAARYGIEKIKTIGDSYMAVSGAPVAHPDHAARMADFALALRAIVRRVAGEHGHDVDVRIGVASGPVLAGIIGSQKFSYDVWGDTVNIASRLEALASPGAILTNAAFRETLTSRYVFEDQGLKDVKGLGSTETWQLVGEKGANAPGAAT